MFSRSTALAGIATAVLVMAGCGSMTQEENADEFRSDLAKTGVVFRMEPKDETRPGLVVGRAATRNGTALDFVFDFGPAPEKTLPEPARQNRAVWFNHGDEVFYWVADYPKGLSGEEEDRALNMKFKIGDVACQVVADRNCDF
ncbi:MAG: hypothetical protein WBP55_12555 [Solirubrobacterales bacterium]